jgi:hypothetical protein
MTNLQIIVSIILVGMVAGSGIIAAFLWLTRGEEVEPKKSVALTVAEFQPRKLRRGDYVELRNGMNATITDVDVTCIRARINGMEGVSQTFNRNGRHVDYDFLDIVKKINHVDMMA